MDLSIVIIWVSLFVVSVVSGEYFTFVFSIEIPVKSVDPDQMLCFAMFDLGLHCLHMSPNLDIWPRGYKTFFVLNSVEHEILNAHTYKSIKKFSAFLWLC